MVSWELLQLECTTLAAAFYLIPFFPSKDTLQPLDSRFFSLHRDWLFQLFVYTLLTFDQRYCKQTPKRTLYQIKTQTPPFISIIKRAEKKLRKRKYNPYNQRTQKTKQLRKEEKKKKPKDPTSLYSVCCRMMNQVTK